MTDLWSRPDVTGASAAAPEDPRTLTGMVADVIARTPDAVAVRCGARAMTWRELDTAASGLAARLTGRGLGRGSFAGIHLPRGPEFVVAMLAVLRTGAGYVPVPLGLPPDRLRTQLTLAGVEVVIDDAAEHGVPTLPVSGGPAPDDAIPGSGPAEPSDPAYIIFTSGSTGEPKGVLVSHAAVIGLVSDPGLLPSGPADRVAQVASVGFDAAVIEMWTALLTGAELVVFDDDTRIDPARLRAAFAAAGITLSLVPTPLLASFTEPLPAAGRPLRQLAFGGDTADPVTVAAVLAAGVAEELVNAYGPTETTVVSTYHRVSGPGGRSVPIGRARRGLTVRVLDPYRQLVPIGVRGEIHVGGDGLALGYVGDPERTADRFVPDPFGPPGARLYRTGDIGHLRPDGELEFGGRLDEQVKIRGHRIEPGEVRSALSAHPGIAGVEVLARPAASGLRLVGYYTAAAELSVAGLRRYLGRRMPEYMIPSAFVRVELMPLTGNGKVDREALERLPVQSDTAVPVGQPASPRVQKLQAIWADVLGLPSVDPDADFFDLGGDSLTAVAVTRLATQAGIAVSIGELLRLQTLNAVDVELDAEADAPPVRPRPAASPDADVLAPFTPIQRWFLDQPLADHAGYVSVEVFAAAERLDRRVLRGALRHLAERHELLRAHRDPDGRGLVVAAGTPDVPLAEFDLAEAPAACERLLAAIDLGAGRVWSVGLCDRGPDRGQLLVVLAHHLIVDAVSFAVLAHDLERLYELERTGGSDSAAPADSWLGWGRQLAELAGSATVRAELPRWADAVAGNPALPLDRDEPPTADLLRWMHARCVPAHDPAAVILTAVADSMAARDGGPRTVVDVQHHGRVDVPGHPAPWDGVGWFTSMSPIGVPAGAAVADVAAELRARPRGGLDYGLLRYLDPDPAVRARLQGRAGVLLNYRGRRAKLVEGNALLRIAEDSEQDQVLPASVQWRRVGGVRGHDLEIIAEATDDATEVSLGYSTNQLDEDSASRLLADIGAALSRAGSRSAQ